MKKTHFTLALLALTLCLSLLPAAALAADGTWERYSDGWYYYDADGSLVQNAWRSIDGQWYYFYPGGRMASGWGSVGGHWYFFEGGAMRTGWVYSGGHWYYMNSGGAMVTGWRQVGGDWYYFDADGSMVSGAWRNLGGQWYYFYAGGQMANRWGHIGGSWYYFEGGAMTTGWRKIGGDWYYFDPDGAMATGSRVINGTEYTFGDDGAWIESPSPSAGSDLDDCLSAYADVLREGYMLINTEKFALAYINDDDIPELLISPHFAHVAFAEIYTWNNGQLVHIEYAGQFGTANYAERTGLFRTDAWINGYGPLITFYALSSGQAEALHTFSEDHREEMNNNGSVIYYFDDAIVSESEYQQQYRALNDSHTWTTFSNEDGYAVTTGNIEGMLSNYTNYLF